MTTCVILAAGRGSRIGHEILPKPLIEVEGIPLIGRQIRSFSRSGVTRFVVVTGYKSEMIRTYLQSIDGVDIECVPNERWNEGNGLSLAAVEGRVDGPFFLTMADHVFLPDLIQSFVLKSLKMGITIMAVDEPGDHNHHIDLEDVMKIVISDNKLSDIGKHLDAYNGYDIGLFWCQQSILGSLSRSIALGDDSLAGAFRQHSQEVGVACASVNHAFWSDVDTPHDLENVTRLFNEGTV